jgi:hypothetical protein
MSDELDIYMSYIKTFIDIDHARKYSEYNILHEYNEYLTSRQSTTPSRRCLTNWLPIAPPYGVVVS